VDEVVEDVLPARRVDDLGVELHAVEAGARGPRWPAYSELSVVATGLEARAACLVSLSPWLFQTCERLAAASAKSAHVPSRDGERGLAVLAVLALSRPCRRGSARRAARRSRCPARGCRGSKTALSGSGASLGVHAARAAGQDDALGVELGDFAAGRVKAEDGRVHVGTRARGGR
jgi:hypothetical protein